MNSTWIAWLASLSKEVLLGIPPLSDNPQPKVISSPLAISTQMKNDITGGLITSEGGVENGRRKEKDDKGKGR